MKVNISGDSASTIFESIRELTKQSQLTEGDSLPSVRELAEQLGVNRNTVSSAYQRLTKAGIAVTQGRLGTRICHVTELGEQEGVSNTQLFDLADGSPRREWLPNLTSVASQSTFSQYLYGEDTILPKLEHYAKTWFKTTCPFNFEVTLCNGAIDSLERLIAARLVPGDKVIVEDPCYISSANALKLAGMQIIGAAVDEHGMQPDALKIALDKGAKAVLITPRAHNPTGASITKTRANALKSILEHYPDVLVMEDDHFALMAQTEHHSVIPKTTEHWAIFRSVSKGLGPDLRMAFVAADSDSIKRINTRLAPGMSWVSRVLQSFVYTCLTKKEFQQHLVVAKENCAKRRADLLDALTQNGIAINTHIDGLNIWLPVKKDSQLISEKLAQKGWLVRASSAFDIDQHSQAIRISIANLERDTALHFAHDAASILLSD